MADDEEIRVGDIVSLTLATPTEAMVVTVVYIPTAAHECWRLRDKYGQLHYVQTFRIMTL